MLQVIYLNSPLYFKKWLNNSVSSSPGDSKPKDCQKLPQLFRFWIGLKLDANNNSEFKWASGDGLRYDRWYDQYSVKPGEFFLAKIITFL